MIDLPNKNLAFEYENGFYLTCEPTRIGKFIAHYELFKQTKKLDGAIVECGVYKGASLVRFAMIRELFKKEQKKILGFDSFGPFPEANFQDDMELRQKFIDTAGDQSISKQQLMEILKNKNCEYSIELIEGDICETVPEYVRNNEEMKISLLNLDVDIYEPSVTVLENLFPLIVKGGILILDDYKVFPGETKAVDDYFRDKNYEIHMSSIFNTIHYVVQK